MQTRHESNDDVRAGDRGIPAGIGSEPVVTHEGPVIRVERREFEVDGRWIRKDVVRHPGAVTVIPVESDGTILMIRVGRLPVGRMLLEFCAGKLEPGECPDLAAGRELEEEVGRRAGRIDAIGAYYTSPGFCDERMHAFVATGLEPVPRRLEPGEEIEVIPMSPASIDAAILDGSLDDGKSITAWHLFRARQSGGGTWPE